MSPPITDWAGPVGSVPVGTCRPVWGRVADAPRHAPGGGALGTATASGVLPAARYIIYTAPPGAPDHRRLTLKGRSSAYRPVYIQNMRCVAYSETGLDARAAAKLQTSERLGWAEPLLAVTVIVEEGCLLCQARTYVAFLQPLRAEEARPHYYGDCASDPARSVGRPAAVLPPRLSGGHPASSKLERRRGLR